MTLFLAGMARCAVPVAEQSVRRRNEPYVHRHSFHLLDAGGDIAARCPYQNQEQCQDAHRATLCASCALKERLSAASVIRMVLELKLDLSEALALEAKNKGLLESSALERMLRAELKRTRVDQLFAAADRLSAQASPPLTEAEVEAEIQSARAQRRATDANRH